MIIRTKYNALDEFISHFKGVQILSVEFKYDYAEYTLQFRDYIEENYFKKRFGDYMNRIIYLDKCFKCNNYLNNKEYKKIHKLNKQIYKSISLDNNIFRRVEDENM